MSRLLLWVRPIQPTIPQPSGGKCAAWSGVSHADTPFEKLAGRFKVSPVVIGRRAMDLRLVEREEFFSFYQFYTQQEFAQKARKKESGKSQGDFYNNQNTRVGRLFAVHVIRAAKEGRIGFKEAYDLSGLNGGHERTARPRFEKGN